MRVSGLYADVDGNIEKAELAEQKGNTYYYDRKTGLMAKGWTKIDGKDDFFDENTGVLMP